MRTGIATLSILMVLAVTARAQPRPRHDLRYDSPAVRWDEALPLGNGLLGALLWGDGQPLKISLDRTDLWDLRPVPEFHGEEYSYELMRRWVAEGRAADLRRVYEQPYQNAPGPTKIPAGRIELDLPGAVFRSARLDLATAVASMRLADGVELELFVHGVEPIGMLAVRGAEPRPKLVVPGFGGKPENPSPQRLSEMELAHLGYPEPERQGGDDWAGYLQRGWGGFAFAVALVWERTDDGWVGAFSVATNAESEDPLAAARQRCTDALATGWQGMAASHRQWWADFWARSSVALPDPVIERQWYLETYKFGAAARPDAPPITLQGPWTADTGRLPPWRADYHHDLNTELSYWPGLSGNHLEGCRGFVDWLWRIKPNAEAWTRRFFDLPGLNVPMTSDLNGEQMGGWHQYTHSSTTAAWLAHHFYLHWRFSMDREFLASRAWPWLRDTAVFLENVTELGNDGVRRLPLSSSPEIHDNRLEAWFPEITNYDLALIRWTFATAAELAAELGREKDAAHWRKRLGEMPELARAADDKRLLVAHDRPLTGSHRHFSHLMAFHPLGLIDWEDGPDARRTIEASLAELDRLGTQAWVGYSFSWLGNLRARARDGAGAAHALRIFAEAFCLRNGFHVNGDQSGKGYSGFRYRPFTLEGNFAAAAAVQEMLLQSHRAVVRVFPAVPDAWREVSFATLRADGAFLISAVRSGGRTTRVEVVGERGGTCRLVDPFGGELAISGIDAGEIHRHEGVLEIPLAVGQRVVLTAR